MTPTHPMTPERRALAERLAGIRAAIDAACARAGRHRDEVTLVAVAKGHGPETVRSIVELGVLDVAESYVQEWQTKAEALADLPALRWHFVGHLQRNKARFLIERPVHRLHSLDSPRLAEALARRIDAATLAARGPLAVLVEVNLGDEASKAGTDPDHGVDAVLAAVDALPQLRAVGLMCIPPAVETAEEARPYFARLRALLERANAARPPEHALTELSMGMSHDFAVAIEEGATHVRIGTALFGARPAAAASEEDGP